MIFFKCRHRKSCSKILRLVALFLASLVACLILGYFTPTQWGNYSNRNGAIAIYVYNSGIHTDILVPVKTPLWNWQEPIDLKSIAADTDSIEYLAFGFGDRSYFLETSGGELPKISTTFNALFLPTPPAMRVLLYRDIPQNFTDIKCVVISNYNYLNLVKFIDNSFKTNSQNNKNIINKLPNYRGGFYEAKGTYSILRACNDWTAEALRIAEVNTPVWSGLSSAIIWHLKSNC
ncbi:MAG: DUF2459 domain-containing protein [Okeania sp. SIO2H7]|nr:DUF2459 domain-containing protein [Okeania sp. SIO2H7]